MNSEFEFKEVPYGSESYNETLQLRYAILRAPLGLQFSKDEGAKEIADHHFAGYMDEALVCCMILSPLNDLVMKMRQVAVVEELQGSGIGKQMLREAETFCRNRNIKSIVLNARDAVVPFYLKAGYKIISDVFLEVNIPHIKMEKKF